MVESVMVQMPWELLDENRRFQPADHHTSSGGSMLAELAKWADALKAMRQ
jgi:hypothetical protein